MFYLHTSNKTENLLRHLATLIEVDPPPSLFTTEYIVIQSQGMERMISQYMADVFTSWCNYTFLLPLSLLQVTAEKLGMEITPDSFDRAVLGWRIEAKLRDLKDEVYSPVKLYLQGENDGLKRYQLARQLANVFDQYQLMRPQMLKEWEKGRLSSDDPAEAWQMHLWNRLIGDEGSGQHRGELLQRVILKLHEEKSCTGLPRRISVFGLNALPPIFIDYLNGLSKHCDVHLFLLNPCQTYWGDIVKKSDVTDPMTGTVLHHPLLGSLGRQGREFQELLLEKVSFEREISSYEEPFSIEKPRLLHRLQSDILAGTLSACSGDITEGRCLRIVSCHSKQRELAVLKDHILSLLNYDTQLELRDIVVMAPDIQEYAAFIPAVFEDIQHSIADRSLRRRNGYISIFLEFLNLFSGRFGWAEVFDLLQKEQVYPGFDMASADFERLQHWVVDSGIRWGLSGKNREKAGFHFSENSWQAGLRRLLMGYAVDTDQEIEGVLPYSGIEGGEAAIVGGLCEFVDLISKADESFRNRYTLKNWSSVFLGYAGLLFGETDDRDFLEFRNSVLELSECGLFHGEPIEFEVIRKWFEQSSKESRSVSGFLKGQLTFCSMLPMRSIPFQAVCLIGMNYGAFPKIDRYSTYDLMQRLPLRGDRSQRADDRYQFLEALLAARDSLYISYVGQSIQNNEDIPPAVVVTELLDTLKSDYGRGNIVEKHPLHPFSPRYFSGEEEFYSYSEENFHIAKNISKRVERTKVWWAGSLKSDDTVDEKARIDIPFNELLSFYRNPQQYFVERCLGLQLREENTVPDDRESFGAVGLESYSINQHLLDICLEGEAPDSLRRKLSEAGIWPLGVPGDLSFEERNEELRRFADKIIGKKIGQMQPAAIIDIAVGRYHLQGMLSHIYEGGILLARYADIKGKDLLVGWLHHLAALLLNVPPLTYIVQKSGQFCFDQAANPEAELEKMITHYVDGCLQPSKLFIEPAFQYCLQSYSRNAKILPLHKAMTIFSNSLENGYEPAWSLLYSDAEIDTVLDEEFEDICELIMMPLVGKYNGK